MTRKQQAQVMATAKEQYIVLPLLAVALIVNAFLFSVTYTNASFSGVERPFPQAFAPSQISQSFDRDLSIITDNLKWSVSQTFSQAKEPVLTLLGLEDYKFGQPRYSALASQASFVSDSAGTVYAQAEPQISGSGQVGEPQVLGAFTINYEFFMK